MATSRDIVGLVSVFRGDIEGLELAGMVEVVVLLQLDGNVSSRHSALRDSNTLYHVLASCYITSRDRLLHVVCRRVALRRVV